MGLEETPVLKTGARVQLQAGRSGPQQPRGGPAAELTAPAWCCGQPSSSLGLVLTKHSPILHVCSVCASCLSSFHLRSSAIARTASADACGTEAGRWHQGLPVEGGLGFVPGVTVSLGSWDMPSLKHPGVSWGQAWAGGIEVQSPAGTPVGTAEKPLGTHVSRPQWCRATVSPAGAGRARLGNGCASLSGPAGAGCQGLCWGNAAGCQQPLP